MTLHSPNTSREIKLTVEDSAVLSFALDSSRIAANSRNVDALLLALERAGNNTVRLSTSQIALCVRAMKTTFGNEASAPPFREIVTTLLTHEKRHPKDDVDWSAKFLAYLRSLPNNQGMNVEFADANPDQLTPRQIAAELAQDPDLLGAFAEVYREMIEQGLK